MTALKTYHGERQRRSMVYKIELHPEVLNDLNALDKSIGKQVAKRLMPLLKILY